MYLEDKIFYRAITALHTLFVFFYFTALIYCYLGGDNISTESLFIPLLPLICKESLIYIAYGKNALLKKWGKSFVTLKQLTKYL